MTSLAIIFVLLLVVFVNASRSTEDRHEPPPREAGPEQVWTALQRSSPEGMPFEWDPRQPEVLRVVIPDSLLNFEFGKSTLAPAAEGFLAEFMPLYARELCGPLRDHVAGIVIEGHTDDLGSDAFNFRLSQERSFRVLIRGLEAIGAADPGLHACFSQLASASGRGKQDLLYDSQGQPDQERSRRVVLKILLRATAGATPARQASTQPS
jgi:outer membrane protein OmpA-like peptidoglycan-associated protein